MEHHPTTVRQLATSGKLQEAYQRVVPMLNEHGHDTSALLLGGLIYFQAADFERCRMVMQRLVETDGSKADHWSALGKSLVMCGMLEDARTVYEKARSLDATQGTSIAGLVDVLNRLGRRDDAAEVVREAQASGVDDPELSLYAATLLQQTGRLEEAVIEARKHLENPAAAVFVRGRLGFLLGRALEDLGRYDESFVAYAGANKLRASSGSFDASRYAQLVEMMIGYFTRERMAALHRSNLTTDAPVFILGMPRSGTTLTEQFIAAHPDGYGAGETPAMDKQFRALMMAHGTTRYPEAFAFATPDQLNRAGQAYLMEAAAGRPGAKRVVDKYLRNSHLAGMFWMVFPHSRIIWCRREAMDTCWSCFTNPLPPTIHPWSSDLNNLGLAFRLHERLAQHWDSTLDLPLLSLPYEEMVAQPEDWIRKLIDFCGLPWDDACLKAHESKRAVTTISYDQVRRPVFDSSIGRWKPFAKYLEPLRESLRAHGQG